jgi:hypothetical protein
MALDTVKDSELKYSFESSSGDYRNVIIVKVETVPDAIHRPDDAHAFGIDLILALDYFCSMLNDVESMKDVTTWITSRSSRHNLLFGRCSSDHGL